MAGYGSFNPQYPWAREWVEPTQEEAVMAPPTDPYQTLPPEPLYNPQERDAVMQRLKAGAYSTLNPGKPDAVIHMEVANEQAEKEKVKAVQDMLPKLMQAASLGHAPSLNTLKAVVPYFEQLAKPPAAAKITPTQADLSNPQGLASFLAAKSGTGADNLNYTAVLQRELAAGKPLPEAIDAANKARAGVTGEVAFSRGQGYGTGANTGPAARAKTDLAGNIEQRKLDVQSTPQAGLGGKSPAQTIAEQKSIGGMADEQRKNQINMVKTRAILTDIDTQSQRVFKEQSPGWATLQRITGPLAAASRYDPNAAAYVDTKESALGELARSISAERGVLTNVDIQRVGRAMPNWGDTKPIRDYKMARLNTYINVLEQLNEALLAPRGIEQVKNIAAQYKPQLNAILDDLERASQGGGTPKPAAKGTSPRGRILSVEEIR